MKTLIVMPRFAPLGSPYLLPAGLPYISASLKRSGREVTVINLNHTAGNPAELVAQEVRRSGIDVVCTGGLSAHYQQVQEILRGARNGSSRVTTVVGGGLFSSEPDLMSNALACSVGVVGEGEQTVVELLEALEGQRELGTVDGLVFRAQDRLITTKPRAPIRDADTIAFPDYESFGLEAYLDMQYTNIERDFYPFDRPRRLSIVSSRSCPYSCTFCYHPIGKTYRQRSLDNVFAELHHWQRGFGVNMFLFLDELFSVDDARLAEFCRRIEPMGVKWQVQLRVSDVNPDMLERMRAAGCYCISYGLESGSDTVLRSMKKHTKVAQMRRALDLTYQAKLGVQGNFIFGDEAETEETCSETMNLWLQLLQHNIYLVPIEVYPGTQLYHQAVKSGTIRDRLAYIESGCPTVNVTGMADDKYRQMLLLMYLIRKAFQAIPAKVLEVSPDLAASNNLHPRYRVRLECPHCAQIVEYGNMALDGQLKIGCRLCNRRIDLPPLHQWQQWPVNYRLAKEFTYQSGYAEELRQFFQLDKRKARWLVSDQLRTTEGLPLEAVKLLGRHFVVPAQFTPDHVRSSSLAVFWTDPAFQQVEQLLNI